MRRSRDGTKPIKDDDGGNHVTPSMIVKHLPRRPVFRDQVLIDTSRVQSLDNDNQNYLALKYNFLDPDELDMYLAESCQVVRYGGPSVYNSVKPRREMCYTVDGRSFRYSNKHHITQQYPPHTFPVLHKMQAYLEETFPGHAYQQLSSGLDILYSSDFERGGSVGSHADDEEPWGIVVILSLGQTRWLRIRRRSDGHYYNIEMRHNSLTVMFGRTFQQLYTHQVDKLHADDIIHPRLSFNVRYLEGPCNLHLLQRRTDLSAINNGLSVQLSDDGTSMIKRSSNKRNINNNTTQDSKNDNDSDDDLLFKRRKLSHKSGPGINDKINYFSRDSSSSQGTEKQGLSATSNSCHTLLEVVDLT